MFLFDCSYWNWMSRHFAIWFWTTSVNLYSGRLFRCSLCSWLSFLIRQKINQHFLRSSNCRRTLSWIRYHNCGIQSSRKMVQKKQICKLVSQQSHHLCSHSSQCHLRNAFCALSNFKAQFRKHRYTRISLVSGGQCLQHCQLMFNIYLRFSKK